MAIEKISVNGVEYDVHDEDALHEADLEGILTDSYIDDAMDAFEDECGSKSATETEIENAASEVTHGTHEISGNTLIITDLN